MLKVYEINLDAYLKFMIKIYPNLSPECVQEKF